MMQQFSEAKHWKLVAVQKNCMFAHRWLVANTHKPLTPDITEVYIMPDIRHIAFYIQREMLDQDDVIFKP